MGYELHPGTPAGGVRLSEYLPDAEGMLGYVKKFAASFGIGDLAAPERLVNTRRALAVAEHARDRGLLERFVRAAYDTYWRWGGGIETDAELGRVAERAGLDPAAAVAAASDAPLLARVDAARRTATEAGVTGIPTLDVEPAAGGASRLRSRVVGCQRYDVLADAVRRAGGRRRTPPAG